MKPGSNRRPRSRPNNNNHNNNNKRQGGRSSYDSNGPDGKVRGTAQQVLEKYQGLGRDAATAGDRVAAESYFQFAEHYYRVVNADGGGQQQPRRELHPNEEAQAEVGESVQATPTVAVKADTSAPALESKSEQSVVEVVNVPIMPGPIDVPIIEDQPADKTKDAEPSDVKTPEPVAVVDDVQEDKPKPVRRRRARAKPTAEKVVSEAAPVEA